MMTAPGPVYVRTDLSYPCECTIWKYAMTRRIETREVIGNMLRATFELFTVYSYVGLLVSMVPVSKRF